MTLGADRIYSVCRVPNVDAAQVHLVAWEHFHDVARGQLRVTPDSHDVGAVTAWRVGRKEKGEWHETLRTDGE